MPTGKVIECTSAKFLNNPKLIFSNPKSTIAEPNSSSLWFNNSTPKVKVREINLSISISQLINVWLIFFKLFFGIVIKVISWVKKSA